MRNHRKSLENLAPKIKCRTFPFHPLSNFWKTDRTGTWKSSIGYIRPLVFPTFNSFHFLPPSSIFFAFSSESKIK